MRIGVDIMGGDFMPSAPIEGVIQAQKKLGSKVRLVLLGQKEVILAELAKHGADASQFEIVHTPEYIEMKESPTRALAQKRESSIAVGIQMAKTGKIDAFVSAGHTGAMLVASVLGLGNIEGVSRPTIGVLFPNAHGKLSLLCDVGANVECKPEMLRQFGILGSIFMEEVMKVPNPVVAMLNVGEEDSKGPGVVQEAFKLLKETPSINFVGNVEGRDLYTGHADVYVCDGYTGNIVLKFGESLYDVLKQRYPQDEFMETFNFENYGGVPVLGIKGVSIIGHGISTGKAIAAMIEKAMVVVDAHLVEKIQAAFTNTVEKSNS